MKINPEWEQNPDTFSNGIFFTVFCLAFMALALFFALLRHQTALTLFALMVIIMGVGLRLWSSFSTHGLTYRVQIDKRKVFPGEKIDFKLTIENHKFLPVLVKIRLNLPRSLVSGNGDLRLSEDRGILWHQKIFFHRALTPAKRGLYRTGSAQLITGDFFGFFPRPTREQQEVDILVFPRLITLKPFPILKRILFGKQAKVSPIHDPIHILGTRDYQSFSPACNIHWKATARHHKLQEKIFEVTEQEKVFIILEVEGFLHQAGEAAFERAIEVIAALSFEMDAHHYAVGFLTNGFMNDGGPQLLPAARNSGHISDLFEMLAKIDFKVTCKMDELLQRTSYPFTGTICLYFSYESPAESFPLTRGKAPLMNIIAERRYGDSATDKGVNPPYEYLEDLYEAP